MRQPARPSVASPYDTETEHESIGKVHVALLRLPSARVYAQTPAQSNAAVFTQTRSSQERRCGYLIPGFGRENREKIDYWTRNRRIHQL